MWHKKKLKNYERILLEGGIDYQNMEYEGPGPAELEFQSMRDDVQMNPFEVPDIMATHHNAAPAAATDAEVWGGQPGSGSHDDPGPFV